MDQAGVSAPRALTPKQTAGPHHVDRGALRTEFESGRLILHRSISLNGQPLGSIYLESDLRELYHWLANSLATGLAALALSGFVAFLLAARLQRYISDPVIHLAQTA